ncbi:MAG: aminoglycoside phosphotransferase family protein, partial [Chloroflexota bacterium]|nr:aminoglycoside phosphotransferase family protein [Chloroflexota bacterium]
LWADLEAEIQAALFPHLPPSARERIAARFAAFLDDPGNFVFMPTVIHGDFGSGNLLWDALMGVMTAVIDFGSAGLGDPALDVAALLTYGEPFVRQGFAAYPAMETMLPRARFYLSTFLLQEALYGIEHDDPDAIERGLAPYLD